MQVKKMKQAKITWCMQKEHVNRANEKLAMENNMLSV